MKSFRSKLLGSLALAAFVAAPAAGATTSYDFLFNASRVTNESQYYLNLAVRSYSFSRSTIEPVVPQLQHVETELPVVLLIAQASGRPVGFVVSLRGQGLSWQTVFERVHVPCSVLFRGIDRDPGPPYGKAWGHWKQKTEKLRLSDEEVVGLANVQTARRVTGMSAYAVAQARGEGWSVPVIVADKKKWHRGSAAGAPGAKGPEKMASANEGPGAGAGHGKAHSK